MLQTYPLVTVWHLKIVDYPPGTGSKIVNTKDLGEHLISKADSRELEAFELAEGPRA